MAGIAEAFVVIRPDFTRFKTELELGVKKAVADVQARVAVTPGVGATGSTATVRAAVAVESGAAVASAQAATAAIEEVAVASTAATAASVALANAEAAVASANAAVTRTTAAYNALLLKEGADAEKTAVALSSLTAATARQTAAQERLALVQAGPATGGFLRTERGANAARGALIGLSRITPLTVFGLQATGVAAIVAGAAIARSVSSAAKFEDQLNTLQAVTKATDDQLNSIRATAIELGNDTQLAGISASDAATALTELSKAGISVNDSLAAVRGVLQLAGAASISAGDAAQIVATQLNAFKLGGDQAARVVNLLANASIAASGEIEDFAFAFQQVSSVASQANLSIEQQTALLTELAKAGIRGADAGTSLRTFLLRLIPTTKQAAQFTKVLGVELDGSKTEGEQLSSVIEQYRTQLSLLTPIQRTNVLNQIFGQDAYRASTIIFSQNRGELDKLIGTLEKGNGAEELNAAKAKGLGGAYRGLSSQLETIGVQFGELVDGPLELTLRTISDTITKTTRLVTKLGDLGEAIGKFKPIVIPITFVVGLIDKIPGPIKTAFKTAAKGGLPIIGPALVVLDALDAITGGAGGGDKVDPTTVIQPTNPGFGAAGTFAKETKETFSKAAKALQKKVQDEINRQQGVTGADKKLDLDVTPTLGLQKKLLDAQLAGSLNAELEADKSIEAFFRARLILAKGNKARYVKILGAVQNAHQAVISIQDQIASDRKAEADKQAQVYKQNLDNTEAQLQLNADAANNIGGAENKLIAFYKRQAHNAKLSTEEQLKYQKALVEEQQKRKNAVASLAQSMLELKDEILNTKLSAAQLTDTKVDDEKVYRQQIASLNRDITRQQAIAAKAAKGSQERIDALKRIQKDLQAINGLKATIKGLTSAGGGFSLADLFKETTEQFRSAGSNVSSQPLTPGQAARTVFAARGAQFLAAGGKLTEADKQKLDKMSTTNGLLADILRVQIANTEKAAILALPGGDPKGRHYLSPGARTALEAKRFGTKIGPG